MDRHDRYIEIINALNESGMVGTSHYYQTPEGIIEVWWGSGKWEHKWIELECWAAEDPEKEKQMAKVMIECQVCEKGQDIETGEIAVVEQDGMEVCIQSKNGGFVCKKCWEKFKLFLHDDSTIILCDPDEYDLPVEDPDKV